LEPPPPPPPPTPPAPARRRPRPPARNKYAPSKRQHVHSAALTLHRLLLAPAPHTCWLLVATCCDHRPQSALRLRCRQLTAAVPACRWDDQDARAMMARYYPDLLEMWVVSLRMFCGVAARLWGRSTFVGSQHVCGGMRRRLTLCGCRAALQLRQLAVQCGENRCVALPGVAQGMEGGAGAGGPKLRLRGPRAGRGGGRAAMQCS
jgi:hypothetical protein